MFGKRILLLAAHPDDEVVAAACAIGRAKNEGAEVFSFYPTHGCIAKETLWPWQRPLAATYVSRRHTEGEAAAILLGLTPLAWDETRPARHLWRELPAVAAQTAALVARHNIDQLWVPAYEGGNADHDALNALGRSFANKLSVLEFAEYNFAGGKAHAQSFPFPNGTETVLTLTEGEQKIKRAALRLYASEQKNLGYVGTQTECFRPLASYDYSQPPHPGKLWYARFQWVPFRHPRVDFTRPPEVCAAIQTFLASGN